MSQGGGGGGGEYPGVTSAAVSKNRLIFRGMCCRAGLYQGVTHKHTQWMKDPSATLLIRHVFREIRKLLITTSKKIQWIPNKKKLLREA